ncbi:polyhomeotic-like protein 3 [Sarotherodon galilaeus]
MERGMKWNKQKVETRRLDPVTGAPEEKLEYASLGGSIPKPMIYIIGDSYIRLVEAQAREIIGTNLGLDEQVQWFGKGGMVWQNLIPFLFQCLRGRAIPDVLLIHCGGNDLGNVKSIRLVAAIKQDLRDLHQQFPQMKIIFSAITQRCQWRRVNPKKVDKARRFVNSLMTTFILPVCGCIVHHPQIKYRNPDQFLHDGVHFTPLGNDVFLYNIALCLKDQIQ